MADMVYEDFVGCNRSFRSDAPGRKIHNPAMNATEGTKKPRPLRRIAERLGVSMPRMARALGLKLSTMQYWWDGGQKSYIPPEKPWHDPLRTLLLANGMTPEEDRELFPAAQQSIHKQSTKEPTEKSDNTPKNTAKNDSTRDSIDPSHEESDNDLQRGDARGMDLLLGIIKTVGVAEDKIARLEQRVTQLEEQLEKRSTRKAKSRPQ